MRTLLSLLLLLLVTVPAQSQLLSNYDTCRTQTFYQYIGSPQKETHIEKARTVQDNGIVSAGYVKQAAGQDALIIKQNAQGQVVWQKEYGNAAYDERITDWRELTNRQLLVAGIAKNRGTGQSVFFMMQLAADGTVIWQRSYADVAVPGITNAKIYPDDYGEHFFAVEGNSFIVYGMTDGNGFINWQRNITTNPGTKLIGAFTHASRLLIATNSTESGYKVSNFYYVDYYTNGRPKNIRSTIKLGGATQNSNYILHDVEKYSLYTYYSGIRSVNNGPYEVVRVNINQGVIRQSLETIVTPGIVIDSSARSAINIYGDAVSFIATAKSDQLHTIKLTGSNNYPTYVVWSSSYLLPDSIMLRGNVKTWDAGYLFYGQNVLPGGNKKISQLKTDSASGTAGCISRRDANLTAVRTTFPIDTASYSQNNGHTLSYNSYTAVVNNGAIDTLTACRELQCPLVPFSDNCLSSYQKLYQSYNPGDVPGGLQVINGRTFLMGVNQPPDYIPEQGSAFLAEMNNNGQVIRQKKYVIGIRAFLPALYKTNDSSLLVYGITTDSAYYYSVFLAKIDTSLNLLWIKSLRLSTNPDYGSNMVVSDLKQASDGSYFILYSYSDFLLDPPRTFLAKFGPNGDFTWSKVYRTSYAISFNNTVAKRLAIGGGYVYMMNVNAFNGYSASILMKVSENNGNLVWCKKFSNASQYTNFHRLLNFYNNELYVGGSISNGTSINPQNILLRLSTDGNILSTASLKIRGTSIVPEMEFLQHQDGTLYLASSSYSNPAYSVPPQINTTVSSSFDVITTRQRSGNRATANNRKYLAIGTGTQLYETGAYSISTSSGNIYLAKFAPDGSIGTCLSDTTSLEKTTPVPIDVATINCSQSDSTFTIRTPINRVEQSFLATANMLCASVPNCNTIRIAGDSFICNKTLTYTYRAVRNTGCLAPVQWIYDNRYVQVINETDSFIALRFSATTAFTLKARLTSNCIPYTDSLLIRVLNAAPTLSLGADTTLCTGATLLLRAKKGFKTYRWQDGSTDSVFTATTAGLYYVTATDSCNNSYSDSIQVQLRNSGPVLNLGPDKTFCNAAPITFNARAGFLTYLWQNGSTDSAFTATAPGTYHVRVIDLCNNIFRDTIRINDYRRATALNLGRDTLFCNAVAFQLRAGPGFKSYLWQNGTTDSVLLATSTGLYYVTVTDSCGAVFTDSINLHPDMVVPFDAGADTAICRGDTAMLTATAGFGQYTWSPLVNTASQGANTIRVFPDTATLYRVSAMKQNGCMVKDSIQVNVFSTPAISLGPDARLCAGDTLTLSAGTGFASYTWSTGEHTASIKAYRAGVYTVAATDGNRCTTRDTASILKIIPLPVTRLPAEAVLCLGQPKTLDAGAGFSSYLWSTGATTQSITILATGQYWATVANAAGCRKTDTVRVDKTVTPPANFLPFSDSTFCVYESVALAPAQNFASYLWSTGASARSITVNSSGNYWLRVADAAGCVGVDSVALSQKDCNLGLFFPNSFTPNNDGLNDTYKPKLYGRLSTYQLIIYNRYGQKVFDSNNISEGWNGRISGALPDTGTYIWQCWYQFTGAERQHRSGTLLLIR